jgi:hypothetical protein
MSIAFLFLTYDNFKNINIMKEFLKDQNIYIHPKYPNNVDTYFSEYIINDLIYTEWGKFSIIDATLNLLKNSYTNKKNEWFILLSEDCYPLYDFDTFEKKFNLLMKKYNNKSIFNFKYKIGNYWKTSQWWILNRYDVSIILSNITDKTLFKNIKCAYDEIYFLSVLKWHNPYYEFINIPFMYDVWLSPTIQKSPQYFNHLLSQDYTYIDDNKCLFIRKITKQFNKNILILKKKLLVIYIGTNTNQNIITDNSFDIILIIAININLINEELRNRAIYIINIIYKFYYETILTICNQEYIKNWNLVIFTTETFNINNQNNNIDKSKKYLPYNKFVFSHYEKIKYHNIKKFYYIKDEKNNLAFCYKPIMKN